MARDGTTKLLRSPHVLTCVSLSDTVCCVIRIDLDSPRPLEEQIVIGIRQAVAQGTLDSGAELPSVRQLAGDLGVHWNTVARAYRRLADEGVVLVRRGRGAVVGGGRRTAVRHAQASVRARLSEAIAAGLVGGLSARDITELFSRRSPASAEETMMTNAQPAQVAVALVVAATPWIVVRIARLTAGRHLRVLGQSLPPLKAQALLGRATAAAVLVLGTLALWLPAPSGWMGAIEILGFSALAAIALRVLSDLDRATRATRDVDSPTRTASLVPRRRHDSVASYWRLLLFALTVAGMTLFVWRLTGSSSTDRQLLVPVSYALFALVFLGLYERWIHELVAGPMVSPSQDAESGPSPLDPDGVCRRVRARHGFSDARARAARSELEDRRPLDGAAARCGRRAGCDWLRAGALVRPDNAATSRRPRRDLKAAVDAARVVRPATASSARR